MFTRSLPVRLVATVALFPLAVSAGLVLRPAPAAHAAAGLSADAKPMPDGAPPRPGSEKDKPKNGAGAAGAPDKPFADRDKTTKDAVKKEGFFTVYQKRENLYWEIKPAQMKKQFLANVHYARGIGLAGQLGGLPLMNEMVQFERYGDHVFLIAPQTRIVASSGGAFRRAVDLSFGGSVIASFKVESERDSSVLVDLASLVVSDVTDLTTRLQGATHTSFHFDKDRSSVSMWKVFPKNIEVEALLTYSPNSRDNLSLNTVPDQRYVPISVHYSFLELPSEPYVSRLADDRVGYFLTAVKDMSKENADNYWVRYVNRWKLEKKDSSAAVSEVKEPIVYYIEKTIPEEWRPYVKAGIEEWQKAFEKAGYKNAIIARDQPDDPDWDADDARYSTIRWITSSEPSFGAIGPSEVDPRTGQILNADILLEGALIPGYSNTYRRWAGSTTVEEMMGLVQPDAVRAGLDGSYMCEAGLGFIQETAFATTALMLEGLLPPGQPVPREFVGAGLKSVTMHEVGHTLGLRHNFKSSVATPIDKLQDKAWVEQHGLTGSIMDYDTPNVSSDPSHQGYFFSPTIGDGDVWAIQYGYQATGAATPEEDYKKIVDVARQSLETDHVYGTDEDTYPADALDPRCNIYDLGSDPLAFAKGRAALISSLWKDPRFENKLLADGDAYVGLRRSMDTMLLQYTRALSHATKYLGGQLTNRAHKGDPGETGPFEYVPAAKQREAMQFLAEHAFSPDAFDVPPAVLDHLGNDRFFDWGNNLFAAGRLDYPFTRRVLEIQTATLRAVTQPPLLARMREAEARTTQPFRVADLFAALSGSICSELGLGAGPMRLAALDTPRPRRELERAYVDLLADWVTSPPPNAPEDAQALARLHLSRISEACVRGLASPAPKSDTVRAHLLELRARAKRALEAQENIAETPASRPGGGTAAPAPGH